MYKSLLSAIIIATGLLISNSSLKAQQALSPETSRTLLMQELKVRSSSIQATENDLSSWELSDLYFSKVDGINYAYLHQHVGGIRIFNMVGNAAIRDGKIISLNPRFYNDASNKINTTTPALNPASAIQKAAEHLGVAMSESAALLEEKIPGRIYNYTLPSVCREKVRVELVYQPAGNGLRLAWDVNMAMKAEAHWWNIRIDAVTGNFLQKNDWTVSCDFGTPDADAVNAPQNAHAQDHATELLRSSSSLPAYRVFPLPTESPSHGPSVLVPDPSDPVASPFGWHDTDGSAGAEYTITRGNNVFAYDDIADQDMPGNSPDGTASLTFDFPYLFTQQPVNYLDASTTNLFYVNNMVHDILYHNGFDEASGNFQQNNYGRGGQGNDYVVAEAQDGGGTNNANFSTPSDGNNGWMQMYLWSGVNQLILTINSPSNIAGSYTCVAAGFGPSIPFPMTSDFVVLQDNAGVTNDACDPLVNAAQMNGKIVLITRGTCNFVDKVLAAQNAGAIAVIMINNASGSPFAMGDNGNGSSVTIPSVMISQADGVLFSGIINGGGTVNGTLNPPVTNNVDIDGSVDNGVIVHEYGHGVSNRLTGGPSNSNCLSNGEQAGEGWSDYLGLLFTMKPGDIGTTGRGIGTYARGQLPSGGGIRRYPYSTDMAINPETYGFLTQSSEVHNIGEIWCSALWDMTWGLVDQFGFDPDWVNGTAGNNIALKLVLAGMKLQPCGPGFLDGRDAILQADINLYSGAHQCIIWTAFARRGMGANALQGSANVAGDETEDFTLPSLCLTPTSVPTANFSVDVTNTCHGIVNFSDQSTDIPQNWLWDFGDGTTSILQNPQHTYSNSGSYTVTLIVSNTLGSDTLAISGLINVNFLAAPAVTGNLNICEGQSTVITGVPFVGNNIEWRDSSGSIILSNNAVFTTPVLNNSVTYQLIQSSALSIVHAGPANNSFGAGGYHNTSFEGRLFFTSNAPVRLLSVWVDANGDAVRTINLYTGSGSLIQSLPVFIPNGQSRVTLNFDLSSAGNFQIGVAAGSNLYRNNNGASYPYNAGSLLSITGSNSTTNPQSFYYYLYDWEVSELPCLSEPIPVHVNVESNPISGYSVSTNGLIASFTDQSTGNITDWSWDFGDGNSSNLQNPVHTFASQGTYTVLLTVSSANGCLSVSSQSVTVIISGVLQAKQEVIQIYSIDNRILVDFHQVPNESHIRIFDTIGKVIHSEEFHSGSLFEKKLSQDASGVYTIQVQGSNYQETKQVLIIPR